MLGKDLRQAIDVVGEVHERHSAVLDERHRFPIAAHAHHDVEAGLPHVPQRFLRRCLDHRYDAIRQAQLAHDLNESRELLCDLVAGLADELNQQDRLRLARERGIDGRAKRRVAACEVDHRAIDELDGRRFKRHDVLRALHRAVQRWKADDAERAMRRQRRELQRERARPGQRALAADQQVRPVHATVGRVRIIALRLEDVDVVAADATHHFGNALANFIALAFANRTAVRQKLACTRRCCSRFADCVETRFGSVDQQRIDRGHVVHHVAVANRARAAGIIAGHAAERGLRRRADIDGKPQAVALQPCVQRVENDARFGVDRHCIAVKLADPIEIPGVIDDECRPYGLSALRAAGAPR